MQVLNISLHRCERACYLYVYRFKVSYDRVSGFKVLDGSIREFCYISPQILCLNLVCITLKAFYLLMCTASVLALGVRCFRGELVR